MRCIAIDDEPIALAIIEQYCKRYGDIELKTFSDPMVGIEYVRLHNPDILFLDIEMGGVSGVELARTIPKGINLIFTTAYAQFAIDGFELNAVDFLHKPFAYARFERAVNKAQQQLLVREQPQLESEITVKVEYQNIKIPMGNIHYIEAMDNYIRIHVDGSRPILPQMSMKQIEALLPHDQFMRIHKSYIVARRTISTFNSRNITTSYDNISLPIGRTYQADFGDWISKE